MDDTYSFSIFPNENFVDLLIFQYGWEECKPLHSFGPAIRNHYLFHLILSGHGVLRSAGPDGADREYELSAGNGFLICPGQVNTYWADEKDPWTYAWVEFDGLQALKRLEQAGLDMAHPVYRFRSPLAHRPVRQEMESIVRSKDASPLFLLGHLYLLLDALTQASSSRRELRNQSQKSFYVQEALNFIAQNYHRDIDVQRVAAACNLNRTYFGRVFRQMMGSTPQEYLIRYRLSKSMELMRSTDYPISQIAPMVGYANPLHFSKVFKKEMGVSPRTWRANDEQVRRQPARQGEDTHE